MTDIPKYNKKFCYLPKKFWKKHTYCELVVNQIEQIVLGKDFIKLKEQIIDFTPEFIEILNKSDEHILDLLRKHNLNREANSILTNKLIYSLLIETSYFLQESLFCSVKMRMTVCFTLIRKPFLEILIIILRIICEDAFINKFSTIDGFDPIKTTPSYKKELLEKVNNLLLDKYNVDDLFNFIFNKDFEDSLFNITNSAIHLFTDRSVVKTKKENLNFIFSTTNDIETQWEYIYHTLPILLTFMVDTIDILVFTVADVDEKVIAKRFQERQNIKERYNVS